ncbi:MAG: EI24 domain-containing protein, partial [Deltaproteobacteria bacterium]|nr:EI24 domain-containing protein [Deltaproteobacteria bacterium]
MVKIVQEIKTGAALFFKGQRYIAHHKELLKLAAIPLIAGSLIWAFAIYLFITHFGQLADFFWSRPDSQWLLYIWYVAASLLFVISFFTVTLITYLLFMIIAAPFNDLISE